jgi:hypothetical protein
MSALHKLGRAVRHPADAATSAVARLRPDALFTRHARLAGRSGIDGIALVLSFDCDTDDDARVACDVHRRLLDLGVSPSYAVPGEVLLAGRTEYEKIAETGAEFVNHGHTRHTYFDEATGRHASCFFYDQLDRGVVRADIEAGDATVRTFLGRAPEGFRTPHFGHFQEPGELRFLHQVLGDLGYRYSSSTVPVQGFRRGPAFRQHGLAELPVSGMGTAPLAILDTWSCFAAPDRTRGPDDYRREGAALLERLQRAGGGVINVYGDPIHIHDQPAFFDTIARWVEVATPMSLADLARHAA